MSAKDSKANQIKEDREKCRAIDNAIFSPNTNYLSKEYMLLVYSNEESYTGIIRNFAKYTTFMVRQNSYFKTIYFIFSVLILLFTTASLLKVVSIATTTSAPKSFGEWIQFLLKERNGSNVSIEPLLTALTAFVTAVIVIPVTITKYLFNQKELEQLTSLFQAIQQHNENMLGVRREASFFKIPSGKESEDSADRPEDPPEKREQNG